MKAEEVVTLLKTKLLDDIMDFNDQLKNRYELPDEETYYQLFYQRDYAHFVLKFISTLEKNGNS